MPKKIKKNKEEFSAEQGNLEIVSANEKDDRKRRPGAGAEAFLSVPHIWLLNPIKEQNQKRHEKNSI
jgi:hypothetical protein